MKRSLSPQMSVIIRETHPSRHLAFWVDETRLRGEKEEEKVQKFSKACKEMATHFPPSHWTLSLQHSEKFEYMFSRPETPSSQNAAWSIK